MWLMLLDQNNFGNYDDSTFNVVDVLSHLLTQRLLYKSVQSNYYL